jgi:putative nucleotidyltransferase with HDIG domain
MGFCLWQRFSGSGAAFRLHRRRLWVHAATVAAAARYLAGLAKQDTSLAFSAGLLHDIGKLVLGFRLQDRYWAVLEDATRHNQSVASIEREVFTCDHATVGAWLLQKWQLPTVLVVAVGMHHDPLNAALAVACRASSRPRTSWSTPPTRRAERWRTRSSARSARLSPASSG